MHQTMKYITTENVLVGIVYGFSFGIAYALGIKFANTIFSKNNLSNYHPKQLYMTHRKKLTKSDILFHEYIKWKQSKNNYSKVLEELKDFFKNKELGNLNKQLEEYDKIRLEEVRSTRNVSNVSHGSNVSNVSHGSNVSNVSSTKDIKSLFDAL